MANDSYEGWAVLELMGHRRLAGYVREVEQFGTVMLRLDVPADEERPAVTQYYGGGSVYCLTPTTEDMVLAVCRRDRPAPVSRYELPAPRPPCETEKKVKIQYGQDDLDEDEDREDEDL